MKILGLLLAAMFLFSDYALAAEYIIKLKDNVQLKEDDAFANLPVRDRHPDGNLISVDIAERTPKSEAEKVYEIMNREDVDYIVENIQFHTLEVPNDPEFEDQWHLFKVNAVDAWNINEGSKDVVVAVIDTGVAWQHPDLASTIWTNEGEIAGNGLDDDGNGYTDDIDGWDFFSNDENPDDETSSANPGHGTHCAGIIGAVKNNDLLVSGVANVTIMPVRFLGANGSGDLMTAAKAIDYAVNNGAQIISASWGAAVPEDAVKPIIEAIGRANEQGVIFVAAAGNSGKNNDSVSMYPANTKSPNMITVAATGEDDEKPSWSNFGFSRVHIGSPGVGILSTLPTEDSGELSGTSMATPLIAGIVGLMISEAQVLKGRELTGPEAKAILQTSGVQNELEVACKCRVDAAAALETLHYNTPVVVPTTLSIEIDGKHQFRGCGGVSPYEFSIGDESIATIDRSGILTGVSEGITVVNMKDSMGIKVQSLDIRVGMEETPAAQCPFQDELMCLLLCVIDPELPWCELPFSGVSY